MNHNSNSLDLMNDSNMTKLHYAVIDNNLKAIKTLLNNGLDVNSKNSIGNTPLLTALKYNHYDAVQILLDANAHTWITDVNNQTPLEILMKKGVFVVQKFSEQFIQNLNNSNLQPTIKADILLRARCTFDMIVPMNDVEVSLAYLQRTHISKRESAIAMYLAMNRLDIGNVQLILKYDSREKTGRKIFYHRLTILLQSRHLESMRIFIDSLIDWNVIDYEHAVVNLDFAFRVLSKEAIQVFLANRIDVYVKQRFEINLLASLFGNCNVDAIDLLMNEDFDVNAPSVNRQTALHWAVRKCLIKNVQYLLDAGADVNFKDEKGRTALFDCVDLKNDNNIVQLVLGHNADVQVVDINGKTVFEYARQKNESLLELLLARLAFVQNTSKITPQIRIRFNINTPMQLKLKKCYEECYRQLGHLETCQISESVSLFSVLTENVKKIAGHVCDESSMRLVEKYQAQHQLNSLYYSMLKYKLRKAFIIHRFRCLVAEIFSKCIGDLINHDHLVIRHICEFISLKDLYVFANCIEQVKTV